MFKHYKKEYISAGYLIIKNFFNIELINEVAKEILNIKSAIKYYDRNNVCRRLELIYDKSENLIFINNSILDLLNNIFNEKFIIFKDKVNLKPENGEGFYPHYDGIFQWENSSGDIKNGWYEYAQEFANVLVAIDASTDDNGPLEISKIHNGTFEELIKNTNRDGTPNIKQDILDNISFQKILLNKGDIVIFSNLCPHKSEKNLTNYSRTSLYYTYHPLKYGDNYKKYFDDKALSKNTNKSLTGNI